MCKPIHNIFLICADNFYYGNRIFDLDSPVNRDNYYYPFYLLRQQLQDQGVALNTYDYFKPTAENDYVLIFFDIPRDIDQMLAQHDGVDKYLFICESEILSDVDQHKKYHQYFKKIFVWNDDRVDGEKYIKYFHPIEFHEDIPKDLSAKEKLCTMIVAQKYSRHSQELYSARVQAIRWFEENHPQDFDLYGMGWDTRCFSGQFSKLNKIKPLARLLRPQVPSYRGKVVSKQATYRKYKFAICYENCQGIAGYVTEKIFDCFFGGCVPVYWGAPNILDYVPATAFIDRRKFDSHEALYDYLANMDEDQYRGYLNAIQQYILSDQSRYFRAEYYAQQVSSQLLADQQRSVAGVSA